MGAGVGEGAEARAEARADVELSRRDLFPENVKQALVMKARSRFEQPGEAEGQDALRVVLVERGGREEAISWVPLP